jgi:hypothetical protein
MWISGSPGTGKSAIASTLVSNLTKQGRLGSFFFFKRDDVNLSDPSVLWRTVAYDLAQFHPSIKYSIVEFLRRPGFRDTDILLHFEGMIEDVLKKNHNKLSKSPPVIVLDALDECGRDDTYSPQRRILLDTLTRWSHLPRLFKLIITSRDDRVPNSFHDRRICRKITLETGENVSPETQQDIRIFFEQCFDDIRPSLGFPLAWPGDRAIDQLTERAGGLFIWAKTAIAFMEEKWGNPDNKLKLILAGYLGKHCENIDVLYQQILEFYFKDADDTTLELFKRIVGTVIVARVPLRQDELRHFLRLRHEDEWQFNAILHHLSSVLDLEGFLRLKHLSFSEFLIDPDRCRAHRFIIDWREQHRRLTHSCLWVMNTELRFNICGLESSYIRNDDVADLSLRMERCIPGRLSYSCRFWAAHLCETIVGNDGCDSLLNELREFFYIRTLYWLEVMSLIKEIPASSIALLISARWMEVSTLCFVSWFDFNFIS